MSPTDKNNLFAFYLATVSKSFPPKSISCETKTFTYFQSPCQTSSIILLFLQEIKATIDKNLNRKEVSGHDLVSDEVIKELPKRGLLVTCIFNIILFFVLDIIRSYANCQLSHAFTDQENLYFKEIESY